MNEQIVTDIEAPLRELLSRIEASLANVRGHESEGMYLLYLAREVAPKFLSLLGDGADLESHMAFVEEKYELPRTGGDDYDIPF